MKYYLHSVDTMDDEKVSELFRQFGYEGTGLFHAILEKLAKQEKPIKTSVLKYQLKVRKRLEKCWSFMEEIGLISSNNGDTFNKQLLNYAKKYQIKKEKTAKKVSEWRERQNDKETVTDYETVSNPLKVKESKVKESKVKESKGELPARDSAIMVMNEKDLRELFSGQAMVEQWCMQLHADEYQFKKFLKNWIDKKILTGNFIYSRGNLRTYLVKDWEQHVKENKANSGPRIKEYVSKLPADYGRVD